MAQIRTHPSQIVKSALSQHSSQMANTTWDVNIFHYYTQIMKSVTKRILQLLTQCQSSWFLPSLPSRRQPNHTAEIPTVKEHRLLNKNGVMWERDVLSRKVTCLRARASLEVMHLCLKLYYTDINMWQGLRIPHIGLTFILGWPMLHHECRTVKRGPKFFQLFTCLPHLNQAKSTFLLVLLEITYNYIPVNRQFITAVITYQDKTKYLSQPKQSFQQWDLLCCHILNWFVLTLQ